MCALASVDTEDSRPGSPELRQPGEGLRRWLLEVGSPSGGRSMLLAPGDRLIVGSDCRADVCVEDRAVSQRHCTLRVSADRVEVDDLDSQNGVYVGSVRVARASVSSDSACFVIGGSSLVLRSTREEDLPMADPIPGLTGSSLGLRRVVAEVRRYARSRAPVLLQGESGTGKDVVARALHQLSRRKGCYVPLNVGALPDSLADAELFGHRRGAFTGAVQSRTGAFEQAHGGTLFLDEVADLSPAVQVKLLRVVEDGVVRALGASTSNVVDVRVISASWADLEKRVSETAFRGDLYHRLSTVVVRIPPLRHRKADIPELCRVLLGRIRGEVGEKRLTSGALSALIAYDWPGNVRELASVLYRASMATSEPEIRSGHLKIPNSPALFRKSAPLGPEQACHLLHEHAGNVSRAARAAGVARSTFRSWLLRASAGDTSPTEAQNAPAIEMP